MNADLWEVPCDTCGHLCKFHVEIGDLCMMPDCPCIAAIPTTEIQR